MAVDVAWLYRWQQQQQAWPSSNGSSWPQHKTRQADDIFVCVCGGVLGACRQRVWPIV